MLIRNDTPFAALGFGDLHRDGMRMAVICARGSYSLATNGGLQITNEQKIALVDVFEGDPFRTPLVRTNDLIPYKPAADITVLGTAYSPRGRPTQSWEVAIAVGDHRVALRVHGPRQWKPALHRLRPTWKLERATAVKSVALDYRLSAGGRFVGDSDGRVDERNPIGPGVLCRDASRIGYPLRAPQIEAPDEALSDPFDKPQPRGFGPIPPFWQWRERHLGTRDEFWQRERCPQMPADLSYRFFQTAHSDLILPHLAGDEIVRLDGLLLGGGSFAFALPSVALVAHHQWSDGRTVDARLTLDGLHLDLRQPDGPWRAELTWRGWVARCPAYRGAALKVAPLAEVVALPVYGEYGIAEREAIL